MRDFWGRRGQRRPADQNTRFRIWEKNIVFYVLKAKFVSFTPESRNFSQKLFLRGYANKRGFRVKILDSNFLSKAKLDIFLSSPSQFLRFLIQKPFFLKFKTKKGKVGYSSLIPITTPPSNDFFLNIHLNYFLKGLPGKNSFQRPWCPWSMWREGFLSPTMTAQLSKDTRVCIVLEFSSQLLTKWFHEFPIINSDVSQMFLVSWFLLCFMASFSFLLMTDGTK